MTITVYINDNILTISQPGTYKIDHDLEVLEILADDVTVLGNKCTIQYLLDKPLDIRHDIKNITLDGLTVKSLKDFEVVFNGANGITIKNCVFYGIKFKFGNSKNVSFTDVVLYKVENN